MKNLKKVITKEPVMVKKTRISDYEIDTKKSLEVVEDYRDFGNVERKPVKSKRLGDKERRSKE